MQNLTTTQAQEAARAGAAVADADGYGYELRTAGSFRPYDRAAPYALTEQLELRLESGERFKLHPGSTVWLHDVTGRGDFWRIYAARDSDGCCYVLTST